MSAKTEISSLLVQNAAVARKYFSSPTACAPLLAPEASVLGSVFPHRRVMSAQTEISSLLAANDPIERNSCSSLVEHSFSVAGRVDDLFDKWIIGPLRA